MRHFRNITTFLFASQRNPLVLTVRIAGERMDMGVGPLEGTVIPSVDFELAVVVNVCSCGVSKPATLFTLTSFFRLNFYITRGYHCTHRLHFCFGVDFACLEFDAIYVAIFYSIGDLISREECDLSHWLFTSRC